MNVEMKNNAAGLQIGNGASDDAIAFFGSTPSTQPSGAAQAAVSTTIATNGSIAGLTFSAPAALDVADGSIAALTFSDAVVSVECVTLRDFCESLRDDVAALQTTVASHANEVTSLRDECEKVGDLARASTTLVNKLRADLVTLGLIKGSA